VERELVSFLSFSRFFFLPRLTPKEQLQNGLFFYNIYYSFAKRMLQFRFPFFFTLSSFFMQLCDVESLGEGGRYFLEKGEGDVGVGVVVVVVVVVVIC